MAFSNRTRVQAPAYLDPDSTHISNEMNDQSLLNPSGRGGCDGEDEGSTTSNPLLKSKKTNIFSTFNCGSNLKTSRTPTLCNPHQNRDPKHSETSTLSPNRQSELHPAHWRLQTYYCVSWKERSSISNWWNWNAAFSKSHWQPAKYWEDFCHIMIAEFNSNPKTTFIACYGSIDKINSIRFDMNSVQ